MIKESTGSLEKEVIMEWLKKDNVGWIDLLRILAIFFVVWSHCCDQFIADFSNHSSFIQGVLLESIGRPCVVLLTMISGYLLLPFKKEYTLGEYYKKRIGRILWPLIFWSIVLPVIFFLYYSTAGASSTCPSIDPASFTAGNLLHALYRFLFNFGYETIPLWYLYMLIGLYLVLPIVNSWLKTATRKDIKTVLWIWFITLFLPYIRVIAVLFGIPGDPGYVKLWGECDWNIFGPFYYFSGFIGYMLMAYYLKEYPLQWSWKKTLAIGIVSYLAGYAITSGGYIFVQSRFPGDYKFLEIPWTMCGINVALQAFGVYIIVSKLKIKSTERLARMATLMFGIYLCHFPFVHIAYDWFNIPSLPIPLRDLAMALSAFCISYAVTWLLYCWKPTRRLVN